MENTNSYKQNLIAANGWRNSVITKLWEATRVIGDRIVTDDDTIGSIFADFLTVGHRPTDLAFANMDVQHFIDHFERRINEYKDQITELREIRTDWARTEIKTRLEKQIKSSYMLSLLNEEKTRRINEANSRKEQERAQHQAWLDKQREKYAPKPKGKHIPDHTPHADKLIGKGLESLVLIKSKQRKQGKFASVRPVKKSELVQVIGLEGLESLKTSGEYVLPDLRKVTAYKNGAVTRYNLHE